ncbi:MAG: hypothetical protein IPK10_19855 [Bacteroidetes bacterium]|nr:hypothetical protein [Bacteroidota bacterium]
MEKIEIVFYKKYFSIKLIKVRIIIPMGLHLDPFDDGTTTEVTLGAFRGKAIGVK